MNNATQIASELSDACRARLGELARVAIAPAQYPEDAVLALCRLTKVYKAGEKEFAGGITKLGQDVLVAMRIGWRPIDTAPKDGAPIELRRVYHGHVVAEGLGVWDFYAGAQRWLEEDRMHPFPDPTHWRPAKAKGVNDGE